MSTGIFFERRLSTNLIVEDAGVKKDVVQFTTDWRGDIVWQWSPEFWFSEERWKELVPQVAEALTQIRDPLARSCLASLVERYL